MFQGKLTADVAPQGTAPHFVTFQIGAFRADSRRAEQSPAAVRALPVTIDAAPIRQKAGAAVPGSPTGRRSVAGRAHRVGRPRHQGTGEHPARAEAGRRAARGARGVAADLRRRLAADGAPGGKLRPDRRAEAVSRARHLGRDSASGRDEGRADDRRDQQGLRTRRSSRSPTTASSATCSRSCPRSSTR